MTLDELPTVLVHGDGITDDHHALTEIFNGRAKGVHPDGTPYPDQSRRYFVSKTVVVDIENRVLYT